MKFHKYYFENYPMDTPFDMANPRCLLAQDGVDEVLSRVIEAPPYTLSVADFESAALVDALLYADILQKKNDKLGMTVPFFVAKDAPILKKLSKNVARTIVEQLLEHKEALSQMIGKIENGYAEDRNLYHMLSGYIFDGLMFDYLEQEELVTTSLVHPSGLDYLVVLYEDAAVLNEYSDKLLCSYNRLMVNGRGFVSFGDSDGERKDFYRYLRRKELGKLSEKEQEYVSTSPEELIAAFGRLMEGKAVEKQYVDAFEYFGYWEGGHATVPVYDEASYAVADELYAYVLELTKEAVTCGLQELQKEKGLAAIIHGVRVKDIANEIYHLVFGEVNELLVASGMVANPPRIEGEGRYFKAFER